MAERRRIIEGTWKCMSCGTAGILGRHKSCPGCGNPRDSKAETQFDFGAATPSGGSTAATVSDPTLLAQAAAGADWYCEFCGSGNAGDGQVCRNCNAVRSGAPEPAASPEPPASPQALADLKPGRSRSLRRGCLGVTGCGCVSLLAGFLVMMVIGWWASQTHEYQGRAVERSWKRESVRELFTRVTREGWQDELKPRSSVLPVKGSNEDPGVESIRDCARRQRGTRKVEDGTQSVCENVSDRVQCGTEERCHTKDLGNGYGEEVCDDVPKYCTESRRECHDETRYREEPVYGALCRYDTWEWRPAGQLREAGREDPPRWPAQPLGELEREKRSESYDVVFEYLDGSRTKRQAYHPGSEADFARWVRDRRAVLTIDNTGELKAVRPVD